LKHEVDSFRVCLEINSGKPRFDFPYANVMAVSGLSIINKNVIITALADKVNQKIYINSVLENNILNANTVPATSSLQIYLGANTGGGLYTNFNFGELIIYDRALTIKEMDLVTKYLSKKWGIKI
jgi:hypothetical protein